MLDFIVLKWCNTRLCVLRETQFQHTCNARDKFTGTKAVRYEQVFVCVCVDLRFRLRPLPASLPFGTDEKCHVMHGGPNARRPIFGQCHALCVKSKTHFTYTHARLQIMTSAVRAELRLQGYERMNTKTSSKDSVRFCWCCCCRAVDDAIGVFCSRWPTDPPIHMLAPHIVCSPTGRPLCAFPIPSYIIMIIMHMYYFH